MNRVVHFEIQADDPARAIDFYENVFGWDFEPWPSAEIQYWSVHTAPEGSGEPGINGGLMLRRHQLSTVHTGVNAFVCTIDVEDFELTAKKIAAAGGKVAIPKFAIPGMAWAGYFYDSEGNAFGVFEEDANASV